MTSKMDIDIVVITPQRQEYSGILEIFSVSPQNFNIPHGGNYQICEIKPNYSKDPIRVALAFVDQKYNFSCISLVEKILLYTQPKMAFLIGSACGNFSKVNICDVVVSTDSISYLGRGRITDGTVAGIPYTQQIGRDMKDAISLHFSRDNKNKIWNKKCKNFFENNDLDKESFKVEIGTIACDDKVLAWSDKIQATTLWNKVVGDGSTAYDMESAGFAYACSNRTELNIPKWAIIRGISDHGIKDEKKYHLEAAKIAAKWLQIFIEEGTEYLIYPDRKKIDINIKEQIGIESADLKKLYSLLEEAESRNKFISEKWFIREILNKNEINIKVFQFAIMEGGIKKRKIDNPENPDWSTTAIKLDKKNVLWAKCE